MASIGQRWRSILRAQPKGKTATLQSDGSGQPEWTLAQQEGDTFTGLTDTPNSYTGQRGKRPEVNNDETALTFTDPETVPPLASGNTTDITTTQGEQGTSTSTARALHGHRIDASLLGAKRLEELTDVDGYTSADGGKVLTLKPGATGAGWELGGSGNQGLTAAQVCP